MKIVLDWLLVAIGFACCAAGVYGMWTGWDIMQTERGWASFIAGAALFSGGLVTVAILWTLIRLREVSLQSFAAMGARHSLETIGQATEQTAATQENFTHEPVVSDARNPQPLQANESFPGETLFEQSVMAATNQSRLVDGLSQPAALSAPIAPERSLALEVEPKTAQKKSFISFWRKREKKAAIVAGAAAVASSAASLGAHDDDASIMPIYPDAPAQTLTETTESASDYSGDFGEAEDAHAAHSAHSAHSAYAADKPQAPPESGAPRWQWPKPKRPFPLDVNKAETSVDSSASSAREYQDMRSFRADLPVEDAYDDDNAGHFEGAPDRETEQDISAREQTEASLRDAAILAASRLEMARAAEEAHRLDVQQDEDEVSHESQILQNPLQDPLQDPLEDSLTPVSDESQAHSAAQSQRAAHAEALTTEDDWWGETAHDPDLDRELGRVGLTMSPEPMPLAPESKAPANERPIMGRYASGDTTYVMFADGGIEAQTPDGAMYFESLSDLRRFIEKR